MKIEDLKVGKEYIYLGYNRVRIVQYNGHGYFTDGSLKWDGHPAWTNMFTDRIDGYVFELEPYLLEFLKLFMEG